MPSTQAWIHGSRWTPHFRHVKSRLSGKSARLMSCQRPLDASRAPLIMLTAWVNSAPHTLFPSMKHLRGLAAIAGLTIGLLAGAGYATQAIHTTLAANVTASSGATVHDSNARPEPAEIPEPSDSPEASATPEPSESPGTAAGSAVAGNHPCNHGFYVSRAAHAHKGGGYVSSVAHTDLGKNGDCSAPLPAPSPAG